MPKVYVTQLPHKRDTATGQLIPIFNINNAHEHGEVVVLMPPQAHYQPTGDLTQALSMALFEYDFDEGDSVLLLGDTTIVAITVMLLTRRNKRMCVLRWDRNLGRYTRVVITV